MVASDCKGWKGNLSVPGEERNVFASLAEFILMVVIQSFTLLPTQSYLPSSQGRQSKISFSHYTQPRIKDLQAMVFLNLVMMWPNSPATYELQLLIPAYLPPLIIHTLYHIKECQFSFYITFFCLLSSSYYFSTLEILLSK